MAVGVDQALEQSQSLLLARPHVMVRDMLVLDHVQLPQTGQKSGIRGSVSMAPR